MPATEGSPGSWLEMSEAFEYRHKSQKNCESWLGMSILNQKWKPQGAQLEWRELKPSGERGRDDDDDDVENDANV